LFPRGVRRRGGQGKGLTDSLPQYLFNRVVRPALAVSQTPVIFLEEWQTAECACRLSGLFVAEGLRDRTVIFWTANNSYGFHRIDWPRLPACTTVASISRYTRSIIRTSGVDAQVIPNGIPAELLEPGRRGDANEVRRSSAHRVGPGIIHCWSRTAVARRRARAASSKTQLFAASAWSR
jgi:hypothetical protein